MARLFVHSALLITLTLAPLAAHAEAILDHLPEDALGFAVARNLSATNAKLENVLKIFQELSPQPLSGPLTLVKAATGLGAGLNKNGDALLAVLPADEKEAEPWPLLVVPVSDYEAFAGSVNGDATGEICRVTIAGEEVLAAKRGSYAAIMNVEHRERFEKLLASEPKPLAAVAPLSDWLAKTDVAAVLMPAGVDIVAETGQAGLARQSAPLTAELRQVFDMYSELLGFLGAEIDAVAAGLAIDDQSNIKLLGQAILTQEGELADLSVPPTNGEVFTGYADEPFVAAGGGPVPPSYAEAMSKLTRKMVETFPTMYGFEDLTEKDWKELEDSWLAAMKGMRSMSMIILPGEDDDPLYSNMYALMKVDDAENYLESAKKSMKVWNDLIARGSSDIKLEYETTEVEVADKKGLLMTADVLAAARDDNVPMVQSMMKAMFGEDGKMKMYFIAADDKTIVMAISDEDGAAEAIEHAAAQEKGLAESSHVVTARKLLDPKASWQGLISPPGCVAWFKRMFETMLAQFGGPAPAIPEYPDSPPIGVSLKLADGRFTSEMAWPVDTLKALADFIKEVQDAFQ